MSDNTKQIRVHIDVHAKFAKGAAQLSYERGRIKPMTLPEYLQEAVAFFEAKRPKAEK